MKKNQFNHRDHNMEPQSQNSLYCHTLTSETATDQNLQPISTLSNAVFDDDLNPNEPVHPAHSLYHWKSNIAHPHSIVIYASSGSSASPPLGFFFAMPRIQPDIGKELLHLWLAAIDPFSRGLGIFPFLMRQLREHAQHCGYSEMTVCTYPKRFGKMYRILKKHGWEEVAWLIEGEKILMKISL